MTWQKTAYFFIPLQRLRANLSYYFISALRRPPEACYRVERLTGDYSSTCWRVPDDTSFTQGASFSPLLHSLLSIFLFRHENLKGKEEKEEEIRFRTRWKKIGVPFLLWFFSVHRAILTGKKGKKKENTRKLGLEQGGKKLCSLSSLLLCPFLSTVKILRERTGSGRKIRKNQLQNKIKSRKWDCETPHTFSLFDFTECYFTFSEFSLFGKWREHFSIRRVYLTVCKKDYRLSGFVKGWGLIEFSES